MAKQYFQVNLPKTFLPFIDHASGSSVEAKVKSSLAIGMLVEKQVTLARAAELAELSLAEFVDLLNSKLFPGSITRKNIGRMIARQFGIFWPRKMTLYENGFYECYTDLEK